MDHVCARTLGPKFVFNWRADVLMAAFIFSVVIQIAWVQEMYCGTLSNLFAPAALGSRGLFALNTEPWKIVQNF